MCSQRSRVSTADSPATSGRKHPARPDALLDLDAPGFIGLRPVLGMITVSRSTWYKKMAMGVYPAPVSMGPGRRKAYRRSDIKALIERLAGGLQHE